MLRLLYRASILVMAAALPWRIRRIIFCTLLGWKLHPTSYVGPSLILADRVELAEGALIGRLNIVSPIGLLRLDRFANLGSGNRVVGMQRTGKYGQEPDRRSQLIIEEHASITRNHILDCSNSITIGKFSTFAGYRSQVLTHSPDFSRSHQTTRPVRIGSYCFVGTGSIILFDTELPNYCILSAGSVLNGRHEMTHSLYAGNPAKPVKELSRDLHYFHREIGRFTD